MRLIATWTKDQDSGTELPSSLRWDNGTPATLDDYERHQLDTHSLHGSDDGGMECHMFPDIIADVTFDANVNDWVMRGQGVNPAALGLNDPAATDEAILAEIFTFPTVYRHRIIQP